MPDCVACGVDLDPAVSTPHTISVEKLCCIASQDDRGNHISGAAVAGGAITEVKPGRWTSATLADTAPVEYVAPMTER